MKINKVTIIGLGLIGGSLAGALTKSKQVREITGIDKDPDSLSFALDKNIITNGSLSIDESVKDSDVIVIATYVDSIPGIASELGKFISEKTFITDVGSAKQKVVKKIESTGGITGRNFVGSHPIAGKEQSGVEYSDPDLFKNKLSIITPTDRTDLNAVNMVSKLWETAGSNVIKMDPVRHDFIFSYVSHLPHVVAYSLINTVVSADSGTKLLEYAGGGLKDYTRIAASSPEMWTKIFMENKENLLGSIKLYKEKISEIEKAIESGDEETLGNLLRSPRNTKPGN